MNSETPGTGNSFTTRRTSRPHLGIEAAELNEVFLWKSTEGSRDVDLSTRVKEELADVLAYALLMAEAFGLDPQQIVLDKVKANAEKVSRRQSQRAPLPSTPSSDAGLPEFPAVASKHDVGLNRIDTMVADAVKEHLGHQGRGV